MKLKYSLVTRRTFLNTLFGGTLLTFGSGVIYSLWKFAFPTVGREPEYVVLSLADFGQVSLNSVKPFAWGGTVGLFFVKADGTRTALKGVCTHMDCNVDYRPEVKKFFCACHEGWFDESGLNIAGPPPRPLEFFDVIEHGDKLIVARKGYSVDLSKV